MHSDFREAKVSNAGERVLETENPRLVREHKDRYRFALSHITKASKVLDCACGTGYGSAILAQKAKLVTGVDYSDVAVSYAKDSYTKPNLRFAQGNAQELSIPSNSIDVYCSFETLEHVPEPGLLIKEAKRVLANGGKFLVSTPNRVFSGLLSGQKPENPFHLYEWSLKEFDSMLRNDFSKIHYFCQRVKSNNKLHPKYLHSKARRLTKQPDLIPLAYSDSLAQYLDDQNRWMPMVYLAVCER